MCISTCFLIKSIVVNNKRKLELVKCFCTHAQKPFVTAQKLIAWLLGKLTLHTGPGNIASSCSKMILCGSAASSFHVYCLYVNPCIVCLKYGTKSKNLGFSLFVLSLLNNMLAYILPILRAVITLTLWQQKIACTLTFIIKESYRLYSGFLIKCV